MNFQIKLLFLKQHQKAFSLALGSLITVAWTLLRFFDQSHRFDLYGQQVLAHQWLNGLHTGAVVGPTNYVLKMIVLYMPFDALPLSPHAKMIVMALIVNIVTYVLLVFVLEKISRILSKSEHGKLKQANAQLLSFSLVWFATLAGSVFWIQYTNSRNLEMIGGLFLSWLLLRFYSAPSWRLGLNICLLASIVFFADPLQLYMITLPTVIFIGLRWFLVTKPRSYVGLKLLAILVALLVASYAISKSLLALVTAIWHVQIGQGSTTSSFIMVHHLQLGKALTNTLKEFALLYSGGAGAGSIREACNILATVCLIGLALVAFWHHRERQIIWYVAIIWICNIGVYIVSGQALQADTSRYLIMTAPTLLLVVPAAMQAIRSLRILLLAGGALLVCLNVTTVSYALARNWHPNFPLDQHLNVAQKYMTVHGYTTAFASMDTAIPGDYVANFKVSLLPLRCLPNHTLAPNNLFFDRAAFITALAPHPATTPVILDGTQITNYPAICSQSDIEQQLGQPVRSEKLSDGSISLIYTTQTLLHNLPSIPAIAK